MRPFTSRAFVLTAAAVLIVLCGMPSVLLADPPGPDSKQAALEQEYQAKIRELARLRDQIDRVLRDLDRKPPATDADPQPRPATPPADSPVAKPTDIAALKLDRVGSYGGGFAYNMTIGWEFTTTSPLEVTQLGVWDSDSKGLAGEMPVGLWDASGKLIVSAQLPAGDKAPLIDQFRYVTIKPTTLEPGQRYVIAALYGPKAQEHTITGGANYSTAAPIRWLKSRRAKTEELAFPEGGQSDPDLPGSFGPNFLVTAKDAEGTRNFYRLRMVPQPPKMQAVMVPEQADGSHREDPILNVSLYARPDGKLTQVMLDDQPLGIGDQAYQRLAELLKQRSQQRTLVPPTLRVASMPQVRAGDLQTAMAVVSSRHYNPLGHGGSTRDVEVTSLYNARTPQPQAGGKFVAPDRFRDAGDYIEDRWTGLLWQKDGTASAKLNFYEAKDYAATLELGGLKDWRVPRIDELATIYPATYEPFTHTKYTPNQCCSGPDEFASYWTSQLDTRLPDYAFVYQWYARGGANNCYASKNYAYVRCVHDPVTQPAAE